MYEIFNIIDLFVFLYKNFLTKSQRDRDASLTAFENNRFKKKVFHSLINLNKSMYKIYIYISSRGYKMLEVAK